MLLFHPEWSRTCGDCVQWLYGDDGKPVMRCDEPQKRPRGAPTPCHKCPKIPEGVAKVRENAVELSEKNARAYLHFLECRAVGRFPNDPIVRRNARILRALMDEAEQKPLHRLLAMLSLGANNGRR